MKITQKDKMMLMALAIIAGLAVFFMYGIMPLKNANTSLETKLEELKEKHMALQSQLIASNPNKMEQKIDELLRSYYENKEGIWEKDTAENLAYRIRPLIEKNFPGARYNMSDVKFTEEKGESDINGNKVVFFMDVALFTINIQQDNLDVVKAFCEAMLDEKSIVITGLRVNANVVDDKISLNISIDVKIFLLEEGDGIPSFLPNVNVTLDNSTLTWDLVANAKKYEIYTRKTEGDKYTYTKIGSTASNSYKVALKEDATLVVIAIGDMQEGFYKSNINLAKPIIFTYIA